MQLNKKIIAVTLFITATGTSAQTFTGQVVSIADGDTLTVLVDGNRQVKVRLAEIDAPEKKQPFGTRSRQALGDLCFRKPAEIKTQTIDRYGRTVARVKCAGRDANADQVRTGMAWVYDRYVTDRSLYAVQAEAKAARRGLWADAAPVPPWDWRRHLISGR